VDHAHQLSPADYSSISGMRNCKAKGARRLRCATARGSRADSHGIHFGGQAGLPKRAATGRENADFYERENILTILGDMLGNSRPGPDPPGLSKQLNHKRRRSWAYLKKLLERLPLLRA
jgi:hypothetical protein